MSKKCQEFKTGAMRLIFGAFVFLIISEATIRMMRQVLEYER